MVKKRQRDFQRVKLKPGRSVSKTANLMDARFKAKKITMPNKTSRSQKHSTKTISGCMEILSGNPHPGPRKNALADLNKLILNDPCSLPSYLSDVLDHSLRFTGDTDENVRNAASEVIVTILMNTDDLQLQSFVPLFIKMISCSMANTDIKIKEHSLKLLTPLLKHHPSLICHSIEILTNLLQMLIGSPRTRNNSQSKSKNVAVFYSDDLFSPDWRIHILGHINYFLKEMLKMKLATLEKNSDEQEVYWDSKSPLYLPIYAEGGLKPFDIEKYYCNSSQNLCEDSEQLSNFMESIVDTLPSVFIEEIAYETKSDDSLYDFVTIRNISIVFQIFCSLTDWPTSNMNNLNESIKKFLKHYVYDKRKFPFIQKGAIFGEEKQGLVCLQLNLHVIFLLCTHLSDSLKENNYLLESVISYMDCVYTMSPEVKYQCIPMIIRITKLFFVLRETRKFSDFLHASMSQLFSLLKLYDDNDNKRLLLSFFTKMSLEPAYSFVLEYDVMTNWFKWLLNEPFEMLKNGRVNKELLRLIKKIANRKFPSFQRCLREINFLQLLGLLKSDDDDICDAVIFLIYNMEDINSGVLNEIARLISSDDGIRTLFAIRLIRLLTYRFYKKPENGENIPGESIHSAKGLMVFTQFLLNVAIDSINVKNEKFINYDANGYTKAVKDIKNATSFTVVPSLHWKKHAPIFKVCIRFLNQLETTVVTGVTEKIFIEILDNMTTIPMHCAIAMIQLMGLEKGEEYYRIQRYDLILAGLLTISVLTQMHLEADWYQCNVLELTNSMQLNSLVAPNTFQSLKYLENGRLSGVAGFFILRICRYFVEKQLLDSNSAQTVLGVLETLTEKCSDKTLAQQPLFKSLFRHFSYF